MPVVLEKTKPLAVKKVLSPSDIVRAWEDKTYRARLTPEELKMLPEHPVGSARLVSERRSHQNAYSQMGSCDNCSSSNCSSSNCSSDNCSSTNCSSDNCSSSNCSGNLCSNWDCGGGGNGN